MSRSVRPELVEGPERCAILETRLDIVGSGGLAPAVESQARG